MLGFQCLSWGSLCELPPLKDPEIFSLPAPIPSGLQTVRLNSEVLKTGTPNGQGFASGRIRLGELEVTKISSFKLVWRYRGLQGQSVSFYRPVGVPKGFHCLGHYCQSDSQPLRGFVLAARQADSLDREALGSKQPLAEPIDYTLIWSSNDKAEEHNGECGYFWLPQPPEGYRPIGFVVTNSLRKPELREVRCVRADLTDKCEAHKIIITAVSKSSDFPLFIWRTRPSDRGMWGKGVSVGTFFCRPHLAAGEDLGISCLRNLDPSLHAMPNTNQIHALIRHYGPTVFFHPGEIYLPSSVSWFFGNGAVLCRKAEESDSNSDPFREAIDEKGSNLPLGGTNDEQFWIDLPSDEERSSFLKRGNLESSKLYVHVKLAMGGTFTDLAFWVFCPFNGPATLKLGLVNVSLSKIGQHVGDWEHFTLRICNFSGELCSVYFSQHSGGEWVEAHDLEFVSDTNKAIVYSSKNGHASFPRPGTYLQGSSKLGVGIRNDAERSDLFVESSSRYEVVAAEYLGGEVVEPPWLQYMREWGPKVVYDTRAELQKIVDRLPWGLRRSVSAAVGKLPVELSGEEGPTGPKEKNNWFGDERW